MEINTTKTVKVNAKTISLYMKVSDTFAATLNDQDGAVLKEHEGYVPKFFPGDADGSSHYGDYLILDIELDTGKILNWKIPTAEQIEEFIEGE